MAQTLPLEFIPNPADTVLMADGGANYGFAEGHAGWVFHGTLREANFGLGPSTGSVWCRYPALW